MQAHGFSQEASFLAAPTIGAESHVKFLAIADMGQAEVDGSNEESEMIPALNTTRLMIAEADDKQLLIHNGDISYARYVCSQWLWVVAAQQTCMSSPATETYSLLCV